MAWGYLVVAICCELAATLSLRKAVDDARWYAAVVPGYLVAFVFLSLTLAAGMPLGVAYGIWIAAGVALAAGVVGNDFLGVDGHAFFLGDAKPAGTCVTHRVTRR